MPDFLLFGAHDLVYLPDVLEEGVHLAYVRKLEPRMLLTRKYKHRLPCQGREVSAVSDVAVPGDGEDRPGLYPGQLVPVEEARLGKERGLVRRDVEPVGDRISGVPADCERFLYHP